MNDPHVKALLLAFLDDARISSGLPHAGAAKGLHHSYRGGLAEHILSVLRLVLRVADHYPMADRDLMMAGAFLVNVMKAVETSPDKGFESSDESRLVGQAVLTAQKIREKALALPHFPPLLEQHLTHLVISRTTAAWSPAPAQAAHDARGADRPLARRAGLAIASWTGGHAARPATSGGRRTSSTTTASSGRAPCPPRGAGRPWRAGGPPQGQGKDKKRERGEKGERSAEGLHPRGVRAPRPERVRAPGASSARAPAAAGAA